MLDGHGPQGPLVGATLGSYRVTGRIGAGGMGVVYRAEDVRLGRPVAVKALPDSLDSDPVSRRKLMDEARRASRVVSPYVATVFDVVEQDDRAYIVMELIEGRRFDEVLRDDRPGLELVTGCAIEIAEALTAIHGAGLVHRDLKPANVMITPAGHVKVMDFGLAREDAAALLERARSDATMSTETTPGTIAGTILYMSPEQVRGERLDVRSDLFSFGTLFYEAVTGKHPFVRESIFASASAILHEPPAPVPAPAQLTGTPVGAIVDRLLEKDRDRRYASADAVLADLRAFRSGVAVPAPLPRRKTSPLVRRVTIAAGLAALALTGYLLWPTSPRGNAAGSRPTLAVLPFTDRTGDPQGDLRAELLADLVATDFADSTLVRAITSDRVREILQGVGAQASQAAALGSVAKAADVRWIVVGTLYKEADALYAVVGVYRPGATEPSETFRAAAETPAAIAALTSASLRERLFPNRKDDAAATAARSGAGSTNEAALLLQQEAKRDFRELRFGEAIEKLEKAVRLDPGFLSAQVRLAEALDRAGYGTRARETADRALRTVEQSGGAARSDRLALESRAAHARIHNDADAEIASRRALVALHGDDPTAHVGLATALGSRGRVAEALPEIELAIALDSKDPGALLMRARLLVKAKRYDEASTELDRVEALFTASKNAIGKATLTRARGDAQFARAQFAQAEALYQAAARDLGSAGLPVLAANSRKGAGDCELMQGHLDAAVAIYEPVLAVARSAGDHRMIVNTLTSLGGQYIVRGNREEAERVLREARREASGLGNPRLLADPTLNLASVLGSMGRAGESRALAEEALATARDAGEYEIQAKALLLLANAHFREGRLDDAIRSYRDVLESEPLAKAKGTPLGNVHLGLADILWEAGRTKDALESAEQAVAINRAAGQRALLGYSLVARARVRADLRLDAGADQDLDDAAKLAADPAAPLADLTRRVDLARARAAATRSEWDDAERRLTKLREAIGPASEEGMDATILGLSATVALDRHRDQDALRYARRAVADATVGPVDRTRSRIDLARAYERTADPAAAMTEARRGLDESERMGVPLVTALACMLVIELGGAEAEALRTRGRAAIERYLDAAPEDRREAIQHRTDVERLSRAFDRTATVTQSR